MPEPVTPESTIENAFTRLKDSVSSNDAHVFQSTTLEDVWKAAEEIERRQRQRKALRNMKRIEPLLQLLEKYSKLVEILCNGTPFLPWVWAPIKLMLELASGHISIFDKLVDAYAQIAEVMPHFDRLQGAFSNVLEFRMILAMACADIAEFHRRAYKFFRRRAWHVFFDSLWKSFDARFNSILASLARHKEMVTKEAAVIDLVEARDWRLKAEEDLKTREKKRLDTYLHDTTAWLNIVTEYQDDELDRLLSKRLRGTCDWIFRNEKMRSWKDDAHGEPVLWVKGIPGAGKTILCTYLIDRIQQQQQTTSAYYICNSYTSGKNLSGEIMRSLTLQLLRQNMDLAAFAFENYANKGYSPSVSHLRTLLEHLLKGISTSRICIDGLDEYPPNEQRSILRELLSLAGLAGGQCRVLFSSRDVDNIRKVLQNKPTISFRDEEAALDEDIKAYVHDSLVEIREHFKAHKSLLDDIQSRIIAKANGMFLWVRLVIMSLGECDNAQELKESIEKLPEGLDEAYGQILDRIMHELSTKQSKKAIRILEWLACSFRLLKVYEVQDGIALHTEATILNDNTKLPSSIIDLCKPLIEEGPGNTVDFVHYSAKEYILHQASGPFLSYVQAHYDIAFSCITYLNSSACFYNPSISVDDLRVAVVKGFHGLHPYASEFWVQHLLQYYKCFDDIDGPHFPLEKELKTLLNFWKDAPGTTENTLKLDDTTTADSIRDRMVPLADIPWLQKMGADILTFRLYLCQEKFAHQDADALEARELNNDPTKFSETRKQYQGIVKFLVDYNASDPPQGVTVAILNDFKSVYTDTAFLCRYLDCPRHSNGFCSVTKRSEHESSHAKPLRCSDQSCEFFARGFNSRSGLLKHNRKYHPAPEEIDPPKFEPKKEEVVAPYIPPVKVPRPEPSKLPEPVVKQIPKPQFTSKQDSRAKRGASVHNCRICSKVYSRAENLKRHQLTHEPPKHFCQYGGCGRAYYRPDLLLRHHNQHQMTDEARAAASALIGAQSSRPHEEDGQYESDEVSDDRESSAVSDEGDSTQSNNEDEID